MPVAISLAPAPSRSMRPLMRVSLVLRSTVATRTALLPISMWHHAKSRARSTNGLRGRSFNTNRPPTPLSWEWVNARLRRAHGGFADRPSLYHPGRHHRPRHPHGYHGRGGGYQAGGGGGGGA